MTAARAPDAPPCGWAVPLAAPETQEAARRAAADFFALPTAAKVDTFLGRSQAVGTYGRTTQGKEMVLLGGGDVPDRLAPVLPFWRACHHQALDVLAGVASSLDLPAQRLLSAAPSCAQPGGDGGSLLRMIYHPGGCRGLASAWHEDSGLLSLVLKTAQPALRTTQGAWRELVELEEEAPAGSLLVLPGRALAEVTNQAYSACLHSVAATRRPRLSLVYHLRLRPDAWLDSEALTSGVTGPFSRPFRRRGDALYRQRCLGGGSIHSSITPD